MKKRSKLLTFWLSILIIFNAAQAVQEVFTFGFISWIGEMSKPDSEEVEESLTEDKSFAKEFDEILLESEKAHDDLKEKSSEDETSSEKFEKSISTTLFSVGLTFLGYLAALIFAGFLFGLNKWAFWGYCASIAFIISVSVWEGYNIMGANWNLGGLILDSILDLGGIIILIVILQLGTPKDLDQLD